MQRRFALFVLMALLPAAAPATTKTWLIPMFAERVPGAFGSYWQSELRLTNLTSVPASVTVRRLIPSSAHRPPCTLPAAMTITPRQTIVLRSIGCGEDSIAGAEIEADEQVRLDSVLFGAKNDEGAEVLTGISTTVPVGDAAILYPGGGTITNMVVDRRRQRVNLFLLPYGGTPPVMPRVDIYDADGRVLQTLLVSIPTNRLGVVTNVLSGASGDPCCAPQHPFPEQSVFSIEVGKFTAGTPTSPAYVGFASVIDNETNDSTIFAPLQVGFRR